MTAAEEVVRAWFEAFGRADMDAARSLLAEDAVLHASGRGELAGEQGGGFDGFMDWYRRKRAMEGPGFAYRLDQLIGTEEHAVAVLTLTGECDGRLREWSQIAVYRIRDGRIAEIWLHEDALPV